MDMDKVQSVCEGKAQVNLPPSVFYNPVQEFNRDLTVAVIRNFVSERSKSVQVESVCKQTKSTPLQPDKCSSTLTTDDKIVVNKSENNSESQSVAADNSLRECIATEGSVSESCISSEKGIRILEGLAASGLRSVRFALEVPGVREVVANDFDRTAVEFIRHNAEKNGVTNLITASCADAAMLMYSNRHQTNRFDVIDLDPYGSPAQFLDAAVQCVADGGIMCVTCTDMAVLCGNAAETCRAKYGAVSLRAPFCHEMALRILLQSIASHAARYQRYIEPLLSLSVDFYVRVFVRVRTGQSRVKDLATQLSNVHHCRQCGAVTLQPLMTKNRHVYVVGSGPPVGPQCDICGGRHVTAGPIWSAPIHNTNFVKQVFEAVSEDVSLFPSTRDRIRGVLSVVLEELEDCPLYYVGDDLCSILHCVSPGFLPLRSALLHAGYKVSLSHAKKNSIKTNAPPTVLWDVMRCWVRRHPVTANRLQDGSAAKAILSKEPMLEANFAMHPAANPASRISGLVRWQMNPDRDWGPKPRAARSGHMETVDDRRTKGEQKAQVVRQKRKTSRDLKKFTCKKYREGNCSLGDSCQYSHEDDTADTSTESPMATEADNI